MTGRFIVFCCLSFFIQKQTAAQDLNRFKSTIDTLCTHYMGGRGYVNDGDKRAADYIQERFKSLGLKKFGESHLQYFPIPINTFPDKVELKINGKELEVGKDFIISPNSGGGYGINKALYLKKKFIENPDKFIKIKGRAEKVLIYQDSEYQQLVQNHMGDDETAVKYAQVQYKAAVKLSSTKLTSSMSQRHDVSNTFIVDANVIDKKIKKVEYKIDATYLPEYVSQNVVGYIEGTTYPDSFIVVGGHYDHLGFMGSTAYFPGANDNASGVAMVLELAEYFSKPENKPEMTIVFMAFGGEEVGLVGSKFFCENPYFDLDKIKFMLSLDLFGAGSKGITAVNAPEYPDEYELLKKVNSSGDYLPEIKSRKPTANSDHYFFYKNGVPSFFLYTLGELTAYHDIYDQPGILEYSSFDNVFGVLKGFLVRISK